MNKKHKSKEQLLAEFTFGHWRLEAQTVHQFPQEKSWIKIKFCPL